MDFFEYWKALNTRFDEGNLTALTQLVGYKLFAAANDRKFPESFTMTDRELQSRAGVKSGQTIVEARRQLKNAGLIDFKAEKARPTRYWLIKQDSSKIQASVKQESSKRQASESVPNIRVREDVKTEDVKTKNNDDGACANTSETDEVLEYWEEQGGGRLTFEHQSEMAVWLSKKGLLWLKEAMKTAADSNNNPRGISFNYLKAIVNNRLNANSAAPSEDESKPSTNSAEDMLKALEEQINW